MSAPGKLGRKQETLIAALLTEPTHAAAATKAGISEATAQRWLRLPEFQAAYCQARRELVEGAIGRMQAATGQAVDTLLAVANDGEKDSDRVRAAVALLDHAFRGLTEADALHSDRNAGDASPMDTGDVVNLLAARLRQVDQAELSTTEKSRLTAALADALLRAVGVNVLDKRLEALQAVLLERKGEGKR
jgi:Arc/MetJ family transcription regulator